MLSIPKFKNIAQAKQDTFVGKTQTLGQKDAASAL